MDFEMAVWEVTSLLIAPKKVFKSIYYHVSGMGGPSLQTLLTTFPEHRNVSLARWLYFVTLGIEHDQHIPWMCP